MSGGCVDVTYCPIASCNTTSGWSWNVLDTWDLVPPELGNLDNLESLALGENRLTGAIPSELGGLSSLLELVLEYNDLASIPSEIGDLANLLALSVDYNKLTRIPSELGDLDFLQVLRLSGNELTSIPPEIGDLSNLEALLLEGNAMTRLPSELGDLTNLLYLNVAHNHLTNLPPELGSLDSLRYLLLADNEFTGSIPPELGNLSRLQELSLAGNQLTGAIPPELGNLDSLRTLELQDNRLTGSIPPELGNLELLEVLWLDDNDLSGPISPEFVRSAFLHDVYFGDGDRLPLPYLFADNNRLSGPTPAVLDSIPNVGSILHAGLFFRSFISLAGNELTGSVPRLPAGDVRRNYFSGCIPLAWRLEERTPRLRVNPQRTSTGGTVNLRECISASGATAVTGADGVAVREYLRDELRENRERAILEYSEGQRHSIELRPPILRSWTGKGSPGRLRQDIRPSRSR